MRRLRAHALSMLAWTLLTLCPGLALAADPAPSAAPSSALDPALKPNLQDGGDNIPDVFRNMGVVQHRAMAKGGRFLLASYGSFDFSDGPFTNYALNVNPGYAISDFLEIYVNVVPVFFVSPRSLVKIAADNGFSVVAAKPLSQIGGEILWAPAYGKDSLGVHRVIRSDTFFKLGAAQTRYDVGNGLRFVAGIGKTYFLGRHLGFRFCANFGYVQSSINGVKAFRGMALLESGLTLYL